MKSRQKSAIKEVNDWAQNPSNISTKVVRSESSYSLRELSTIRALICERVHQSKSKKKNLILSWKNPKSRNYMCRKFNPMGYMYAHHNFFHISVKKRKKKLWCVKNKKNCRENFPPTMCDFSESWSHFLGTMHSLPGLVPTTQNIFSNLFIKVRPK